MRTLVLSGARSRTERELVRQWTESTYGDGRAQVVPDGARELAGALDAAAPDTTVVPVRVVWPPDERASSDEPSLSDLFSLSPRRRGVRHARARLRGWSADRARVVAGDAATLSDLRREGDQEVGSPDGSGFVAFVRRRATLACDRAERRLTGDRYKVPRLMAEQIVASTAVARRAADLAGELGLTPDEVLAKTSDCLEEMAAVQSPPAIEAFRSVMSPLHRKAWDVDVDTASLERLREQGRRRPLIFLPSHRSYADPLVLAEVLHAHDFPRNHVLGGDNLAFWPLGALGRRAGIVFIRRSFGDDAIYKFAVREYLGHLLDKRFNLEWYIEGGRTRTGKLRPPKYGLLRYLVDAAAQLEPDSPGRDPLLVPVSLHYDQLHEVGALAAEQGGAGKKAEGLGWLAGYMRDQQRRIGSARVRFGEPLALRAALDEAGEGRSQLEKVAFRIAVGINRATPVTPTSVVTFALLGAGGRALTFEQVRAVVEPVRRLLERLPAIGDLALRRGAGGHPRAARLGGRRRALRRGPGGRVVDRARPSPRRRLLPQRGAAPPAHAGRARDGAADDRRRRPPAGRGPRGVLGDGPRAARPAEVRLLLLPQAGVPRRAARRARPPRPRLEGRPRHARRCGADAGPRGAARRAPHAAAVRRVAVGGGDGARRPGRCAGGPRALPRRLHGPRAAVVAPAAPARRRRRVPRALLHRVARGGEPGTAGCGRRHRRRGRPGATRSPASATSCAVSRNASTHSGRRSSMPLPSAELDARRATVRAAPSGSVAVVDETALLDASAVAAHAGEALRSGRTSWRGAARRHRAGRGGGRRRGRRAPSRRELGRAGRGHGRPAGAGAAPRRARGGAAPGDVVARGRAPSCRAPRGGHRARAPAGARAPGRGPRCRRAGDHRGRRPRRHAERGGRRAGAGRRRREREGRRADRGPRRAEADVRLRGPVLVGAAGRRRAAPGGDAAGDDVRRPAGAHRRGAGRHARHARRRPAHGRVLRRPARRRFARARRSASRAGRDGTWSTSPRRSPATSGSRSPASTSTCRGAEHLWSARPVRLRLQPPVARSTSPCS